MIRRYKAAFTLNVIGLAVALSVAAMVFMQLRYDYGFDADQPQKDNIYLLHFYQDETESIALAPRPAVDLIADVPGVEAVTIMNPSTQPVFVRTNLSQSDPIALKEGYNLVDEGFTDVFDFDFVAFSGSPLKEPEKVIIPEGLAKRLTADGNALGMTLMMNDEQVTVGGIFRDFAENSSLDNCIYQLMPFGMNRGQWQNFNYNLFIRVKPGTDINGVTEQTHNKFQEFFGVEVDDDLCYYVSLADMHFTPAAHYDMFPKADKGTLFLFLTIALVIIAIACINLTNFNTALSPLRAKSLNTMKVFGGSRASLVWGIILESMVTGFMAWLLSLLILFAVRSTPAAGLISAEIDFVRQLPVLLASLLTALAACTLSGLYPAFYLTSFQPVLALKGNMALSPKGRKIRSALVALQFLVSFVLLGYIGTITVQTNYMKRIDLGYEYDRLLVVDMEGQFNQQSTRKAFHDALLDLPEVENCATCNVLLSSLDANPLWGSEFRGEFIEFTSICVSEGFFETIGATITEGRGFRASDDGDEPMVFNETARRTFGMTLDDSVIGPIVGFVDDLRISSLRGGISPTGFIYNPVTYFYNLSSDKMYIRMAPGVDPSVLKRKVQDLLEEFVPYYPFEVNDNDYVFAQTYAKEQKSAMTITLFCVLAVLISLVGVFGLVAFDSEARRKEIAVRKVMGAETSDILRSFNRSYLLILLVCFVIAVPIAFYFSNLWLQNFTERIGMPWWVFVPALILMAAIVSATVTGQCWRIASSNPSESLKSE